MKKRILFILISCFAILSTNMVQAELPVFSTNATTGAHWYRMKNAHLPTIPMPAYLKVNTDSSLSRANADATDNFLFCFVGDATNGFQIYNKALGAELVVTTFADWLNLIVASSTPDFWNAGSYIWTFDVNSNLLVKVGGIDWYFRATSDRETVGATYYGGPDAVWNFEDSSTPIVIDKSALISLIAECNTQVNGDKADSQKATTFATAISTFEAAIAAAQAVVDNNTKTADDVTTAVNTLKYARTNYNLSIVVLPFTLSTEGNMVWYKVINYRRDSLLGGTGYLTYDGSALLQTASTDADNQLWAFGGDNIAGINIYNKANFTDINGVKLNNNGSFTMSADAWSGVWKVNSRTSDGIAYYGICNVNGAYMDFNPNDYFHGLNTAGASGGIVLYGFTDFGSLWSFVAAPTVPTSIEMNSASEITVFSHDGVISVNGAKGMASIFSMTGSTATFDTQRPYNVGGKGIYIVRVNGEVYKVMVK